MEGSKKLSVGPIKAAALALEFGFIVGGVVTVGTLLGRFLDSMFETDPILLLLGLLTGLGLSFYTMYLVYEWQK